MSEQRTRKKAAPKDWHRADIIAALRKAGWSLRKLATHHGYSAPTTLSAAMDRRWPKGQRLIADAIGVTPHEIWPSWYPEAEKDSTDAPQGHNESAKKKAA